MIIIGATNFPEALDKYVLPLIPSENITAHILEMSKFTVFILSVIIGNTNKKELNPPGCVSSYMLALYHLFLPLQCPDSPRAF